MQDPSTAFQGIRPPTGATAQFSAAPDQQQQQMQQQQEQHLKCPRCDSTNTKFCYYNNYNLSQPRHFCKSCRRYWTKGGALRNIPVGGGTRKNSKRSSSTSSSSNGGRGGGSASNNNNPLSIGSGSIAKRPNTSGTLPTTQMPAVGPAPLALSHLSFAPPRPTMHHHLPKPDLLPAPAMYPSSAADQERQMLDIGGSFSSLLTSSAHFGTLIDHTTFHTVAGPGAMTLPVTGDLGCPIGGSGLELLGPGNGDDDENHPQTQNPAGADGTSSGAEDFLGLHGVSGCWDGDGGPDGGVDGGGGATGAGGGWPGLSIYTPGSSFR